jgi:hypothetical protein
MASNAFLQALQPRSHTERFKRLNEYFQKVYNGQEDFSDWENLRNQLILPMFQGLGDQCVQNFVFWTRFFSVQLFAGMPDHPN